MSYFSGSIAWGNRLKEFNGPLPKDLVLDGYCFPPFYFSTGTANISQDRIDHSVTYDAPIDCVWTIRAEKDFKIYLQFPEYQLDQPNDCHLNYIQVINVTMQSQLYGSVNVVWSIRWQVFDGKTDIEHMIRNFCGSVAESVTSKTNVMFVRFYAEKNGINSQFSSVFTAMRVLEGPNDACDTVVSSYDFLWMYMYLSIWWAYRLESQGLLKEG